MVHLGVLDADHACCIGADARQGTEEIQVCLVAAPCRAGCYCPDQQLGRVQAACMPKQQQLLAMRPCHCMAAPHPCIDHLHWRVQAYAGCKAAQQGCAASVDLRNHTNEPCGTRLFGVYHLQRVDCPVLGQDRNPPRHLQYQRGDTRLSRRHDTRDQVGFAVHSSSQCCTTGCLVWTQQVEDPAAATTGTTGAPHPGNTLEPWFACWWAYAVCRQ